MPANHHHAAEAEERSKGRIVNKKGHSTTMSGGGETLAVREVAEACGLTNEREIWETFVSFDVFLIYRLANFVGPGPSTLHSRRCTVLVH